jgi:hypothetical protein
LVVRRLPGVHGAAEVDEADEVVGRLQDVDEKASVAAEAVVPPRAVAEFAEQPVTGQGEVPRDL